MNKIRMSIATLAILGKMSNGVDLSAQSGKDRAQVNIGFDVNGIVGLGVGVDATHKASLCSEEETMNMASSETGDESMAITSGGTESMTSGETMEPPIDVDNQPEESKGTSEQGMSETDLTDMQEVDSNTFTS